MLGGGSTIDEHTMGIELVTNGTVRYLSDEWLRRADEDLAGLTPISSAVEVGILVRSGPEGDRGYRLILGPDRVGVEPGADGSGVQMSLDWDVAVAIANGATSAQRAFLDGQMQLGGDTSLLLGHQSELGDIDDRFGDLRANTRYS